MPISDNVRDSLSRSSWIRRMFEEGNRLKKIHGPEKVYDFSLGNPDLPPPDAFLARLREVAADPDIHRYMPNAGWPQVRDKIAASLQGRTGVDFTGDNVLMTVGAGGAINVLLRAILNPDDEVIVFAPFFVEYGFYVANHGGKMVTVETREDFSLSAEALATAITPRTRAILINSPNNPTGVVYSKKELEDVVSVIRDRSKELGSPIYLVTDEPYRKIVYPGFECPEIPPLYQNTVVITSHSKDLGLAGERIGYIAIHPEAADAGELAAACTFTNRTLGFVNAPSLFQLAIADCQEITVDTGIYLERRNLLLEHLRGLGFEIVEPGGAFYLFPKSPVPDETEFIKKLMEERILVVPGRGFGREGYFRISFAVATETIERSLPSWDAVAAHYRQNTT